MHAERVGGKSAVKGAWDGARAGALCGVLCLPRRITRAEWRQRTVRLKLLLCLFHRQKEVVRQADGAGAASACGRRTACELEEIVELLEATG